MSSVTSVADALALSIQGAIQRLPQQPPSPPPSLSNRVITAMEAAEAPLSTNQLRKRCRIRTQSLCNCVTKAGSSEPRQAMRSAETTQSISFPFPVHP